MPGELVTKLKNQRMKAWEQAKVLADEASGSNRNFEADEQQTWDRLMGEIDGLDVRIKQLLDGESRAQDASDKWDRLTGQPTSDERAAAARGSDGAQAVDFNAELRSYLRGDRGRIYDVQAPTGPINFRTLTTATATSGAGLTVGSTFYNRLMAHVIEVSGVLQAGPTILNTNSGEAFTIPKTVTHTVPTAVVAEAAAIAPIDPTFGQTTLGAFKYGVLLQLSRELIDDTGVDLEGYLAMQAGRALGNYFGSHLVTGGGTSVPRGVLTDATSALTTTTTGVSGAPTAGEIIDLAYSVIGPYRSSASCGWLMRDATVGKIRKLTDTNGQFLWQPSLQVGAPDQLLGKPIFTDPYMPAVATGAKAILFGDFSQYFVRMVGGLRFERSDDLAFDKDLVTFRAVLRGDGALVDTHGALKYTTGAST